MRRPLATRACARTQMLAANQMLLTRREPQHMFLVYSRLARSTLTSCSLDNEQFWCAPISSVVLGRRVLAAGLHTSTILSANVFTLASRPACAMQVRLRQTICGATLSVLVRLARLISHLQLLPQRHFPSSLRW